MFAQEPTFSMQAKDEVSVPKTAEAVDLTNLTADQLRAALALKEGTGTAKLVCSFSPKRADQVSCTDVPAVSYGDLHYCKKHRRTVQAMLAKKEWDASQEATQNTSEGVPVVTPVVAPVVVQPVVTTKPEIVETTHVEDADAEDADVEDADAVVKAVVKTPKAPTKKVAKASSVPKTSPKPEPVTVKRVIKPNKWGRFEDLETGILFDPKSKAAYGVQDRRTGKVLALKPKDIEVCEKYRWKYHVIKSRSETSEPKKVSFQPKKDEEEDEDDQDDEDEDQEDEQGQSGDDQDDENEDQEDEQSQSGDEQEDEEDEDEQEDEDKEDKEEEDQGRSEEIEQDNEEDGSDDDQDDDQDEDGSDEEEDDDEENNDEEEEDDEEDDQDDAPEEEEEEEEEEEPLPEPVKPKKTPPAKVPTKAVVKSAPTKTTPAKEKVAVPAKKSSRKAKGSDEYA